MRHLFNSIAILGFMFVLMNHAVYAQTESDERPLIDVEDGLGFTKENEFSLLMRFRMQNRLSVMQPFNGDDATIEARVRRMRLRFDGYVGNKKLQYYVQLSFSRADTDQELDGGAKIIRDAIIYYSFNPNFYIGFGQSKLPGNRQRVNSSGNLQFGERSIANALLTIDRDFGVFAYKTFVAKQQIFKLKGVISTGEGRDVSTTNSGLAYTGRFEYYPLGSFKNTGDYSEGDIEFEQKPKLSIGLVYSYNNRTNKLSGQLGPNFDGEVNLGTTIADLIFKYKGFATSFEYFHRTATNLRIFSDIVEYTVIIPQGRAYNFQISKAFKPIEGVNARIPSIPEIAFRHSVFLGSADMEARMENLLGYTHYINKHRIKLQLNSGILSSKMPTQSKFSGASWIGLFQIEFGI